ncbi:MAG: phosphate ABC transporter permease subunit PstC [Thermoleophilia bacterium]|nr:phosphate ABC transporter permease subunit PstC [Thermoleophilia bacterium]
MSTATPDAPAGLRTRRIRPLEQGTLLILGSAAALSVLITIGIVFTLVEEGWGFWSKASPVDFLTGRDWFPVSDEFGVLPLLSGSVMIALLAGIFAVPVGLGSAIYLSEYASPRARGLIKPVLELLAGMPTIVLGFFALDTINPVLQRLGLVDKNQIYSYLAAGLVVGLLIVPFIASLSEDALRAVPRSMREGAYGLGATRRVVATKIIVPAALSGIMASIVLALSRAVGETMAVTLAAGTQPNLTWNPFDQGQTITSVIVAVSKGEASRGTTIYQSIFAIGLVLFVVTLVINIIAVQIVRRFRTVYN